MTIDLSVGTEEHALFLPAMNETFVRFPLKSSSRALPAGLSPADLNYLRPNPLFQYGAALHSAAFGAYQQAPTIITTRDRASSVVVGDSGGFTLIEGKVADTLDVFRAKSLRWQEEHCDVGIILDIPTRAIGLNPDYSSISDCLAETERSIQYALRKRQNSDLKLLTVMQGRNAKEARFWNSAIAPYQPDFQGIALAGDTKLDFALWCELLIKMRDDRKLDGLRWIHVLGTAQPGVGAMLTGLQKALRKHLHEDIRISYDASTAFRIVQANKQITTGITYDRTGVQFLRYQFGNHFSALDRSARFPFSSPIGDRSTVCDFNPANVGSTTGWDTLGLMMLSHHEVYKEVTAIAEINRLVAAEANAGTNGQSPWHIRKAWEAFDAIFSSSEPMSQIKSYKSSLQAYKGQKSVDDDER